MLEIPEAFARSKQLKTVIKGEIVTRVVSNAWPHKLTWFYEDPDAYENRLMGKQVTDVKPLAGLVEIYLQDMRLTLSDGVNIRLISPGEKEPVKHQLLLEFDSVKRLFFTVQMYGGIMAFKEGENKNPYYLVAGEKPSPLTDQFDFAYFKDLLNSETKNPSMKALLASEQRIPGLGNGVLQDFLYHAGLHPKRKLDTLAEGDVIRLFISIRDTLSEMAELGGRDTEKDIYGASCGYQSRLSQRTVNQPCSKCKDSIRKESYMGGSIYYCGTCQPL